MRKADWALNKVWTSKSTTEAVDEASRGCEIFAGKGLCNNCRCSNCPIEIAAMAFKKQRDNK